MFKGSRDMPATGAAPIANTGANVGKRGLFSVLGPDVVLTGNLSATADLHIDGRIDGDVSCAALVQGAESLIAGNVHAETARIAGRIEGAVYVRQLTVERGARIAGDVEYDSITIETGASIDGRLKHVTADSARAAKRVEEPVRLLAANEGAG